MIHTLGVLSPSKQQTYMYQHHNTYSNITIQCTVDLNDQSPLRIQPHQSMISVSNSPIFQFYASSIKIIIITVICIHRTNKKKSAGIKCLCDDQPNNIFNTQKKKRKRKQILRISETLTDHTQT